MAAENKKNVTINDEIIQTVAHFQEYLQKELASITSGDIALGGKLMPVLMAVNNSGGNDKIEGKKRRNFKNLLEYAPEDLMNVLGHVRREYKSVQMEINSLRKDNELTVSRLVTIFQGIFAEELDRIAKVKNKSGAMKKYEYLISNFMDLDTDEQENLMFAYDSADKTRLSIEKRTSKPTTINPVEVIAKYETFANKNEEKRKVGKNIELPHVDLEALTEATKTEHNSWP